MSYTIGIDARKIQDFGIGTYVRNLVRSLAAIDTANRYVLLAKPEDQEGLLDLPANFQVALESSPVYSVRELVEVAFARVDLPWQEHVVIDPAFVRPAEVDLLVGSYDKAKAKLGWEPTVTFKQLVESMVDADLERNRTSQTSRPGTR